MTWHTSFKFQVLMGVSAARASKNIRKHQKQEKTFRVYAYIICYFFAKNILIMMIPFFEPKKIVTFA